MPYTVWGAFNVFQRDIIDLEPEIVKRARASRDFLSEQLKRLSGGGSGFPRVTEDVLPYGSFARHTKTRTLNDIDLLMIMSGYGTQLVDKLGLSGECRVRLTDYESPMAPFEDSAEIGFVNSTRVLNTVRTRWEKSHSTRPQSGIEICKRYA